MITSGQLLAFGLAAFVLIAIPGPSVVFVISRALVYGRAVALATPPTSAALAGASACAA